MAKTGSCAPLLSLTLTISTAAAAGPADAVGGIVRNNFISRTIAGDSAIYVADSPNTQVLHNSIFISGT